jgi:hypothetical protein
MSEAKKKKAKQKSTINVKISKSQTILCFYFENLMSIRWFEDSINSDNPMFGCIGLFQMFKFNVFIPNFGMAYSVIARWTSLKYLKLAN